MWDFKFPALKNILAALFFVLIFICLYSNVVLLVPWSYLTLNSLKSNFHLETAISVHNVSQLFSKIAPGVIKSLEFRTNHNYLQASDSHKAAMEKVKPLFYVEENNFTNREKHYEIKDIPANDEMIVAFDASYWRTVWLQKSEWTLEGDFDFLETREFICPRKCAFTDNRTYLKTADAVIFAYVDILGLGMHSSRYYQLAKQKGNQKWIISTLESPSYYYPYGLGKIKRHFDWTFTYRPDSDIYWPYGYFYKLDEPIDAGDLNLPPISSLKYKRLAASLISNCNSRSGRETLIESMKNYVEVDDYGDCGSLTCAESKCRENLGTSYKFILAFENSLCQDYITEKFFKVFTTEAVPVVFGLGDYAEVAPPHSYINVLDFPNVSALTDHLKYLDTHDEEYLKYFEWKFTYGVVDVKPTIEMFCKICTKLWESREGKGYSRALPFDHFYTRKRELSEIPRRRNDTIGFKLLESAKDACVTIDDIRKLNYFS